MPAPKGNQNSKKLKTQELKKLAYEDYCNHIAQGFPHKAWCWEHGDLTLTWQTIETYIREEPVDFNSKQKRAAEAKSLKVWFGKGTDMMTSEARCQPAIYQMIMRNVHGWDKESPEEKHEKEKREGSILEAVFASLDDRYKGKN